MTLPAFDIHTAARLLGGEVSGGNRVSCPGPGHSKRDRSLSVTFANGDFIVNSFAGDDFRECRDHVKAVLGWTDDLAKPVTEPIVVPTAGSSIARRDAALRLWESSIPIAGTPAAAYLASRGLAYDGDALRFRPVGCLMVALMTDAVTGEPCGVHRTYLDSQGNKLGRAMYGPAGIVRLHAWEATLGIGIAEGIETALAADFQPMWACLTAGGIERFPVLPWVECLTIFADHDASGTGQRAALACAERWHAAGKEVTINLPEEVGKDFADQEAA